MLLEFVLGIFWVVFAVECGSLKAELEIVIGKTSVVLVVDYGIDKVVFSAI